MPKCHWVCLALVCSVLSAATLAAAVQPPSPGGGEEVEHEALRRLKSGYEEAVRNNRIDALAPYFHSDFHASWRQAGRSTASLMCSNTGATSVA
jgi:hypothetical protein